MSPHELVGVLNEVFTVFDGLGCTFLPAGMGIRKDGKPVYAVQTDSDGKLCGKEAESSDEPKEYKFPATLKAGERKLAIEFTNDVFKEGEYDRNLYVHEVKLTKAK